MHNQDSGNLLTRRANRRAFVAGAGASVAALAAAPAIAAQGTPTASPAAGGTRVIAHAMGETEVPASPQRVVVLDGPVLDACFALGITPVGATTGVANDPWPAYLGEGTKDIVNVGTIEEPDLELIVGLKPDLIISLAFRHEPIYPQLAAIAPTILSPYDSSEWRDGFLLYADALNRNDQAPAVVEGFDARAAEVRDSLGPAIADTSVSVIRVLTGQLRSYQEGSFSGTVLDAIGLPRPESQQDTEQSWIELSLERLQEIDASAIFVTVWAGATGDDLAQLEAYPLWSTLSAVQNNRVYLVPDEYWMTAIGYLAANLILDDITRYLVAGEPPATPSA